ncbi:unnamed protein product [Medioppia subpectinata]|uniref:Uncharacterized protein n=1 Tax=Medioppia subpectinata TaxID=1979941 RepID=A0A7R9KHT9_9ACAR|nr:unnamed protein product [Medioppia subpectinata]CAG2103668.1 unnamed protein product [Medioppia subpectinata]
MKAKNPRLYRKSPTNGLPVSVEYVDTFGDRKALKSDNVKTIVAIHGNPGHHKHYSGLYESFGGKESSVRVIVPNMPDFGLTRQSMAFWHSNEERSQFIRDFLKAINVSKIDCLISHSAGIQPNSLLWSEPRELTIRSLGIFSPQYLSDRFFEVNKLLSNFARNKFGIAFMDAIKPHMISKGRSPITFNSVDEVLYFVLVHSYVVNKEFYHKLDILKSMKIPTLVVYGENDKLVPKENFERFVERLGAKPTDRTIYADNTIESNSDHNNWVKVVTLKSGELKAKNPTLYRKSPTNGLPVSVEYVDTFGDRKVSKSDNVKTIVAIHGNPGHHKHFSGLYETFGGKESSVRVIAPNMPDFGLTRQSMAFWHSNEERSQLIRDFLTAINVSKIDCLISHSAGIQPISLLWSEPRELTIGSIGLLCPQPFWFSKQYFRTANHLSRAFAFFSHNELSIKVMELLRLELIGRHTFFPLEYRDAGEVLQMALVSKHLINHKLHLKLQHIKHNKIPTLVVFGETDKLIPKHINDRLVHELGAKQTDYIHYSSDNSIEEMSKSVFLNKKLLFVAGAQPTQLHQRLNHLKEAKIPTLVAFGDDDRIIDEKHIKHFCQDLGVDQRDYRIYSADKKGRHFCFNRSSHVINKHIETHLLSQNCDISTITRLNTELGKQVIFLYYTYTTPANSLTPYGLVVNGAERTDRCASGLRRTINQINKLRGGVRAPVGLHRWHGHYKRLLINGLIISGRRVVGKLTIR